MSGTNRPIPILLFADSILGVKPYDWQCKILLNYEAGNPTAAACANFTGKTSTVFPIAALWTLYCYPRARLMYLSATGDQVKNQFFASIKRFQNRPAFADWKWLETEVRIPEGGFLFGRATDTGGHIEGIHDQPGSPACLSGHSTTPMKQKEAVSTTDTMLVTNQTNNSDVVKTDFEVVREVKLGRPLFLTPKRFIRICKLIEQGESASEACRQQLVSYPRFRFHVQRNEKYQRRLKQAEEVRERYLFEFHVANIKRHAGKNLLASLWWLERRHPGLFALRTVVRNEGDASTKTVGDKVSEADLKRYVQLISDFQKENSSPVGEGNQDGDEQQ